MRKYEFGGRRGCGAFAEVITAYSQEQAESKARKWCEEHDAEYEYCILV